VEGCGHGLNYAQKNADYLNYLMKNVVPIIENSDNWIKFLPMKRHYCNVLCFIITKKTFKTGENKN
jgi:hypothetical protein